MLLKCAVVLVVLGGFWLPGASAGDLRIPLPRRSSPTPVQRLNRDGVEAVKKHNIDKAKSLFYQAYLLDPDDPFTLNNLGYIAELEGEVDRAQRYYALALAQTYDARVDKATKDSLEGKTIAEAAGAGDREMQVNRRNLEAMRLLQQDRVLEAEETLQGALKLEPHNPFTLNNLGIVKEKQGDGQGALQNYRMASRAHSDERVIVSPEKDARGREIAEVAERNAKRIEHRLPEDEAPARQAAKLAFLGVKAVNHNDLESARRHFQQALRLDPDNAFTLNNMGFLAEIEGDQETADSYYSKARVAEDAGRRVSAATRASAVGKKLTQVAEDNDSKVNAVISAEQQAKRRRGGPIQLKRRDNSLVVEPQQPAAPQSSAPQQP